LTVSRSISLCCQGLETANSKASLRIAVLFLLALFAIHLRAEEPWKKHYKTWSENDLREISSDSPWAKRIKRPDLSEKDSLGPNGKGQDVDDDKSDKDDNAKKDDHPETLFVVRWVSSRTLRRAWTRGQVLRGRISDSEIEKSVLPAPDDYQITILGSSMNSFDKATESLLQSKTYLELKKSKQKLTPMKVEIVLSSDRKTINAIIFHFAKITPAGETVISSDETETRFVCKAISHSIEVQFNFNKMKDQQGLDL
jgi:hypothetical protein